MNEDAFLCPISMELMTDPVVSIDGNSYQRSAIEKWIREHGTCPTTRQPLTLQDLTPNRALRDVVADYLLNRPQQPIIQLSEPFPVQVQLKLFQQENEILIRIEAENAQQRTPLDICCVIDVSGSMDDEASFKSASGSTESDGLSILDVVKHAVKTIIKSMGEHDRLALVSFTDTSRVELELTKMDTLGQNQALASLDSLTPLRSTNLWAGLQNGLDVLRTAPSVGRNRMSAVLLLTDGVPNVEPPRGHLEMLKRYKVLHKGLPGVVNSFGFGYNLDTKLLNELAIEGQGSFAFIPDASFVGTIFIHACANLLSTVLWNAELTLNVSEDQLHLQDGCIMGGRRFIHRDGKLILPVGSIQYGQTRDFIIECTSEVSAQLTFLSSTNVHQIQGQWATVSVPEFSSQKIRLKFLDAVNQGCGLMTTSLTAPEQDPTGFKTAAQKKIMEFVQWIKEQGLTESKVLALLEDIEGQVMEAFRDNYYRRWGRHYLPSLSNAHSLQQCNNFKDPGVQVYGGQLFQTLRDQIDDMFCKLEPPRPSLQRVRMAPYPTGMANAAFVSAAAPASALIDMSRYNNSSNPCYHMDCKVTMADGCEKSVVLLKKGDQLESGDIVECVVLSPCLTGKIALVRIGELLITPWHPIKIGQEWHFPADLNPIEDMACEGVISLVMRHRGTVVVEGVETVTLGHSIQDAVCRHDYFGSERVIHDLRRMEGWEAGLVHVHQVTKCPKTALVNGLK